MKIMYSTLLAILLFGAARAEWAKKDASAEYDNCLPRCDENNPKEHGKCVSYCECVTDGMQVQFADHDQLVRQVTDQKMPERVASLQKIANSCNQKIWKNPARRLKFQ